VITAGLERLEAIDGALALNDGRILKCSGTLNAALPWIGVATAAAEPGKCAPIG
jgi:hypothetical protein